MNLFKDKNYYTDGQLKAMERLRKEGTLQFYHVIPYYTECIYTLIGRFYFWGIHKLNRIKKVFKGA